LKIYYLRPPLLDDIEDNSNAARDGEIWNSRFSQFPHPNEMQKYIQGMLIIVQRV
jgi:hypothetical protein